MFKIKSVENKRRTTSFRMNAEKLSIKTTKETLGREKLLERAIKPSQNIKIIHFFLVYDFETLIVSIGGYLGLFIGLSLNDLFSYVLDFGGKFFKMLQA